NRIAEVVKDPQTREDLPPRGCPCGSKRVCMVSGYFATFNRPNVKLVNLKCEPIERMTPPGSAATAQEYELDMIASATGFDAVTGPLTSMDISGRGGRTLAEAWADGTRTYLGLQTAGFPNLFMITGPGSPSIVSNTILSIEQHVDWIARCIEHLEE